MKQFIGEMFALGYGSLLHKTTATKLHIRTERGSAPITKLAQAVKLE
jgi:hypothetical protein